MTTLQTIEANLKGQYANRPDAGMNILQITRNLFTKSTVVVFERWYESTICGKHTVKEIRVACFDEKFNGKWDMIA